jgi:hypothetical protein
MRRFFATAWAALLFAGTASGDEAAPGTIEGAFDDRIAADLESAAPAPGGDAAPSEMEKAEKAFDARIAADVERKTDAALRHHLAPAEAVRNSASCRSVLESAEARGQSASERHARLVSCLVAARPVDSGLVADNPD